MRYKLSAATFAFTLAAADAALAKLDAAPAEKLDIDVEAVGISGSVLSVHIPPYDLEGYHKLAELRAYLYPETDAPPTDADGFINSELPVSAVDVSAIQCGGTVPIVLPTVDGNRPYNGQIILGFEDSEPTEPTGSEPTETPEATAPGPLEPTV
ncbi:hypothetical protein [Singulisphaera sp. PoT]|uniref:hypothetical protein n=1 Tax=Singulisphaera sp. PoT TaxID=3411797 RepID=UPI003BF55CCA